MDNILKCTGYNEYDVNIIYGKEDCLYDDRGRKYIDFEAGVWSASLGHCHPRVNDVIRKQIDHIMHLGYQYKNPIVEEAAAKLLEIVDMPGGKCVFLCSGSEAVEFGVQSIRRISGKQLLLSLAGSYLAAYGSAGRRSSEEWYLFDWTCCKECRLEQCRDDCKYFSEIPFENIGGFVLEPGNSSGQVKLPPQKLISNMEKAVRQNKGLIMANEITTGIGRTGKWLGYQHYEFKPDIVSVGKSIGNGYPVSAVAIKSDTAEQLLENGLRYAQSHQNDALGCAVATEVLKVIREEKLIERSAEIGVWFKHELEQLSNRHECIREVRGRGLMLAVEFKQYKGFSLAEVHRMLFEKGFVTGCNTAGNLLRFYPSLVIGESSIEDVLKTLDTIL